jgi:hypothetical protein
MKLAMHIKVVDNAGVQAAGWQSLPRPALLHAQYRGIVG